MMTIYKRIISNSFAMLEAKAHIILVFSTLLLVEIMSFVMESNNIVSVRFLQYFLVNCRANSILFLLIKILLIGGIVVTAYCLLFVIEKSINCSKKVMYFEIFKQMKLYWHKIALLGITLFIPLQFVVNFLMSEIFPQGLIYYMVSLFLMVFNKLLFFVLCSIMVTSIFSLKELIKKFKFFLLSSKLLELLLFSILLCAIISPIFYHWGNVFSNSTELYDHYGAYTTLFRLELPNTFTFVSWLYRAIINTLLICYSSVIYYKVDKVNLRDNNE